MASPAQLVQAISDVTGAPLPTVVDIDRRLAIGGLRSKGGRGLNAARMTALDAARLLTAVLGSPQANASVEAVERYARTQVDTERSSDSRFAAAKLCELTALPDAHGFVDALAALVASAATGSLSQLAGQTGKRQQMPAIEVYAFAHATRGAIRLSGLPKGLVATVAYSPLPVGPKLKGAKAARSDNPPSGDGDLEQSRKITTRTILAIGALLAQEAQDD